MIWLAWRQLRPNVLAVGAAAAVLLALLAVTGPGLADLSGTAGGSALQQISGTEQAVYYAGLIAVLALPGVIGMFWGAPLVSRELETGTHRLIWNQSVTRTRWLVTKLGLTALAAMAAAGVTSLAVSWWSRPVDAAVARGADLDHFPRIDPLIFGARGIVPLAYAAFAFALGVTLGLFIRRTVPAMAAVLVLFVAVQLAMPLWVRPHLATPAEVTVPVSVRSHLGIREDGTITMELKEPGAWLVAEQTVDARGHATTVPASFPDCLNAQPSPPPIEEINACVADLASLHYGQRLTYQPATNFWRLQWAESAIYLGLTAGLGGLCAGRVRRLS
ncbi:ABC transporter permease subunit [Streptomyces sp. NPDC050509]|uniref:ABC transporter permease subunit n=1 Tax=Streptomyces sp. NPDC050509 TaxID=3365620 RepID=UPI00379C527C